MQKRLIEQRANGLISEEGYQQKSTELFIEHEKNLGEIVGAYAKIAFEAQKSLGETSFEYDAYGNKVATVNDKILGSMNTVSEVVGTKLIDDFFELSGVSFREFNKMDESARLAMTGILKSLLMTEGGLSEAQADVLLYSKLLKTIPRNVSTTITTTQISNFVRNVVETYTPPKFINSLGGKIAPVPNAKGGIFNGRVQLGNQLFGEAGKEAVLPLTNENAMKPFAKAVANNMGSNGQTVININNMTVRQEADIKKIAKELDVLRQTKSMARR
jgi:hypothetical protein